MNATPTFVVQMWDGHVRAIVEDKPCLGWRDLGEKALYPDNRVGVGSSWTRPGLRFRITQLQIRKLDEEPPHE